MYTAYLHIKMDYVFYCDDNEIELLATDTVLICYKNLFLHVLYKMLRIICMPTSIWINQYLFIGLWLDREKIDGK